MSTLNEDLSAIKEVEDKIVANKVARFAYTDEAYTTNDANGVAEYDVSKEQNIPTADASVLKVNETVLSKGYRAQASSVTRMLLNHFFGRMSYNLNKVNDIVSNLIATLIGHRGTANGFATLDENGRIPYSQLPESAMEYKGNWNAETNVPPLSDGTGTKGDFYIVSVAGTQDLGSGNIQFFVNDRVIYDGSVWARLSAGDVNTVNNVLPTNGNVALTGENIPVSSTDPTLLSAPLTTDRYADSSVTNAKIKEPISVANGGTGATTAKNGFTNLANGLSEASNPQDTEYMIYKSGGNWGLHTLSTFWNYIKGKISSVLGLTKDNYGGKSAKSSFLDEYVGAGGTRPTSLNIVPKDVSEYGGMRKDIVTDSVTDGSRPSADGHLLTMFWDNAGRYDSQFFVANNNPLTVKVRVKANGTDYEPWVDIITSNNIGSQTVANANYSKKMYQQVFDLTSLDKTKFYPLVCTSTQYFAEVAICSEGGTGSIDYNQNRIHFDISTYGWNDLPATLNIREYACYDNNEIAIGCIGRGIKDGAWAIWLRGGIRYFCYTRDSELSLKTSDYTYGEEVYTVGASYHGRSNTKVEIMFTPQDTISEGAYSSRPITASVIKAKKNFIGNLTGNVNGSAGIGTVHTCYTANTTKEKTISIPGFTLTEGACIRVRFAYGNAVTTPSLNVNDTGDHPLVCARGALDTIIESNSDIVSKKGLGVASWDEDTVLDLYYDHDLFWRVLNDPIVKRFYNVTEKLANNVSITGIMWKGFLYYFS